MQITQKYLLLTLVAFLSFNAQATPLTLNEYMNQVLSTSPGIAASKAISEGSFQASKEGGLQYMPRLTFDGNLTRDEREFTTTFLGGKTTSNNMTFGLQKVFDFGLNAKLSYAITNNQTGSLDERLFPGGTNNYTTAQSQLDLTQSLWRNFLGRETNAQATVDEATSLSTHFNEQFHLKQLLASAETAYYQLAINREYVRLLQEVVDRAKKILDWNTRRTNQHLTDRVDMLQAQSAHQARLVDLANGMNNTRNSQLSFNALRNNPASEVPDEVLPVTPEQIMALQVPVRAETSDDIKAAEQEQRRITAQNELSVQKATPDVALYGTVAYNGVDRYFSPATHESFTSKHPLYVIGLRATFPIYFWETSEIRSGRVKQQLAAESTVREKRLENNQQWEDLTQKFQEAKAQLKLADELVRLQSEKLKYEKYRFDYGRTTTYQVLTFEQDYQQALISRLQIEQQNLNLYAQLKTYANDTEVNQVQGAAK